MQGGVGTESGPDPPRGISQRTRRRSTSEVPGTSSAHTARAVTAVLVAI